ncbi:MAG: ROK family glucokinase [Clostridium sp.]|nr:ROK family glucokinase [Clostridium sp.]
MGNYAFGVDIGGTTIKLGLFDQNGNILDKWEIPTRTEDDSRNLLPDVARSILHSMKERGIEADEVLGAGIGFPGPVDEKGTVHEAANLGGGVFNVPEAFGNYLPFPVKAANDANVAAFGEMRKGGGKGASNLVMVTLGTGVGGGIIVNGNILTGAVGAGGEIGHIHLEDSETEECGCGNKGCLEQYTSATGIVRLAKRRLAEDEKPSVLRGDSLSAKKVFDAIKDKDEVAMEVGRRFGEYLGKGLAGVAAVVNPEVFLIGGGVSNAGGILLDYIRPPYAKYAFPKCREARFALAELGNDAGIYGAAGLILDGAAEESARKKPPENAGEKRNKNTGET